MSDKEFLRWIYYRLLNVYKEMPESDFMKRLKKLIDNYDSP